MDASAVQEQAKRLRAVLVDQARVAEPLADHILEEMGCEGVSDVQAFSKSATTNRPSGQSSCREWTL
eukprot:6219543-Karenia_brevis.AAC.1